MTQGHEGSVWELLAFFDKGRPGILAFFDKPGGMTKGSGPSLLLSARCFSKPRLSQPK